MGRFDDIYCNLCRKILSEGTDVENRTGTNSIKIPTYHFQLEPSREFPVLTVKQVYIRQAVLEMLWIYQEQSNDVRWLQERGVHIWDKWEIAEDGCWYSSITGDVLKEFPKEYAHTIGTAYGYIVHKYKLIDKLINTIKSNPTDRRMVMSLWQDCELETAVLPSCVWSSEWDVTDGRLNVWVHQRSCDVPLGLPFNVAQYAVLQSMIAQVCGLEVGTMDWSIKDAHIYVNQVEGIKTLLSRYEENEDIPAPRLYLNPEVDDFYKFDSGKDCKDVKLLEYRHMGKISFQLTQ